ncbi:Hypothetical protein LUCI_4191 [Lucifera butyrica]|uniref:TATA-box binding n=1 Tax=Lucifera butyrica TaxID=1351585 RepID=A0A498RIJ8_9FIRM|nr:YwmB family TATA-box binding protein [Lucifera butyrica]VBB08908.1 Hypothetical protein LUCI_4191 [Lucifera butyrica]
MKKIARIVAAVVFLMILCNPAGKGTSGATDVLENAMTAMGTGINQMSINGWSRIPAPAAKMNENDLRTMVERAMQELGIQQQEYSVTTSLHGTNRLARAEMVHDRLRAVVIAEVIDLGGKSNKPELYLVVNIDSTPDSSHNFSLWRKKIITIIEQEGGVAHISTCLVGWLDGKLEKDEMRKRLQQAFNAADATMLDQMEYENLVSSSGYAPSIADSLQAGSKKINLNLAMRYSSYDNRTYAIVGSPIITREY